MRLWHYCLSFETQTQQSTLSTTVLSGTPQCLQVLHCVSMLCYLTLPCAHFPLHLAFPSAPQWFLMLPSAVLPYGLMLPSAPLLCLMFPSTVLPCGSLCSPVLPGHLSGAPTCRLPQPGHFKSFSHVNKDTSMVALQSGFCEIPSSPKGGQR